MTDEDVDFAGADETPSLQFRRGFNPGYWYGVLGLVVLLLTFLFPLASARRTARVEERGDLLAETLLAEATRIAPLDLGDPATREMLFGRVLRASQGHIFVDDLDLLPPFDGMDEVTLANKHYIIQLRHSPRAEPEASLETDDEDLPLPLEALAWPRTETGPGHAVFFYPEDAEPAFTRNLQSGYHGLQPQDWPKPGYSHRRPDARRIWDYRDFQDIRWLLLAQPPIGERR